MKFIIYLCALMCLMWLNSCLSVNRITRNCDKFAQLCTTSRETVTIKKDTTIFLTDTIRYQLPPDEVAIVAPVPIVQNQASLKPVFKQFGLINATASISNNILNVRAWLTDSTILIPHADTIFLPGAITTTTNTVTVTKKFIPKFYRFTFWFFIALVSIVALWFAKNTIPLKFNPFRFKYFKK